MSKIKKYPDNHSFQISDFRFQMSDFFNHIRNISSYMYSFFCVLMCLMWFLFISGVRFFEPHKEHKFI